MDHRRSPRRHPVSTLCRRRFGTAGRSADRAAFRRPCSATRHPLARRSQHQPPARTPHPLGLGRHGGPHRRRDRDPGDRPDGMTPLASASPSRQPRRFSPPPWRSHRPTLGHRPGPREGDRQRPRPAPRELVAHHRWPGRQSGRHLPRARPRRLIVGEAKSRHDRRAITPCERYQVTLYLGMASRLYRQYDPALRQRQLGPVEFDLST